MSCFILEKHEMMEYIQYFDNAFTKYINVKCILCYLLLGSAVVLVVTSSPSVVFQNVPLSQRHRPLLAKQREVWPVNQTGRVRGGHVGDRE